MKEIGRKPSIYIEFTPNEQVAAVLLNAETDMEQEMLERVLLRILSPNDHGLIKRLFQRG